MPSLKKFVFERHFGKRSLMYYQKNIETILDLDGRKLKIVTNPVDCVFASV